MELSWRAGFMLRLSYLSTFALPYTRYNYYHIQTHKKIYSIKKTKKLVPISQEIKPHKTHLAHVPYILLHLHLPYTTPTQKIPTHKTAVHRIAVHRIPLHSIIRPVSSALSSVHLLQPQPAYVVKHHYIIPPPSPSPSPFPFPSPFPIPLPHIYKQKHTCEWAGQEEYEKGCYVEELWLAW